MPYKLRIKKLKKNILSESLSITKDIDSFLQTLPGDFYTNVVTPLSNATYTNFKLNLTFDYNGHAYNYKLHDLSMSYIFTYLRGKLTEILIDAFPLLTKYNADKSKPGDFIYKLAKSINHQKSEKEIEFDDTFTKKEYEEIIKNIKNIEYYIIDIKTCSEQIDNHASSALNTLRMSKERLNKELLKALKLHYALQSSDNFMSFIIQHEPICKLLPKNMRYKWIGEIAIWFEFIYNKNSNEIEVNDKICVPVLYCIASSSSTKSRLTPSSFKSYTYGKSYLPTNIIDNFNQYLLSTYPNGSVLKTHWDNIK